MKRSLVIGSTLFLLLLLLGTGAHSYVRSLSPKARQRLVSALKDRFDADVELHSLQLNLWPQPSIVGEGLYIRHKNWPDDLPLVAIRRFTADARFIDVVRQLYRVNEVKLEGLEIHIPPRGPSAHRTVLTDKHEIASAEPGRDRTQLRTSIRHIVADGALVEIEPKLAGKDPRQFHIQELSLWSVAQGQPLSFAAKLTNAKPPGLIDSKGTFGPWQKDDPRSTAVSGTYAFSHADLGVFSGIDGTLSSEGSYAGVLQHIDIDGRTDTPDFTLKRGGAPVHLRTTFHSIVNGTDGETLLLPVDAKFLHSEFVCSGGVIKVDGQSGKTVTLDAVAKNARMEDILQLIIGDPKPFLTGGVNFRSKIIIPPGNQQVLDKLKLEGQFHLQSAVFTSQKVEQRLRTLSDRARGISRSEERDLPQQAIASDFRGRFRLLNGDTSFSQLSFGVPGAQIRLVGDYNLRSEKVDMAGVFRMSATLADTQSGVKHWLLKPLDPFFEKDGAGFQVPLRISGERKHPDVEVLLFHHRFHMK